MIIGEELLKTKNMELIQSSYILVCTVCLSVCVLDISRMEGCIAMHLSPQSKASLSEVYKPD